MTQQKYRRLLSFISLTMACTLSYAAEPDANQIVQQCTFKNPGADQRTTLTVTLRDKDGAERKSVYSRWWKDFKGAESIADKMVLFTEFPPDAKGAAFMRWGYLPSVDKNADQWIYLPALRKIRRVTIRDPAESFLGSDLNHADIGGRSIDQDTHSLVNSGALKEGPMGYVIESTPKESNPIYSRRVILYARPGDWETCVPRHIEYFDTKGKLLKKQDLEWQQVKDAWLWKTVRVENVQTFHRSQFEVTEPEINVGIDDDIFNERTLMQGLRR